MAIKKPLTKRIGNHEIVDGQLSIKGFVINQDKTKKQVRSFYTWDSAMSWIMSFKK